MTAFVTGGGGSIGSELVRQLVMAGEDVTVFELSELALYNVEQSLGNKSRKVKLLLGDIRHPAVLQAAMRAAEPDTIYHAAALKHVPILEHPHNLIEAVRTNVIGTANVMAAAREIDAHVVVISTDKAVEPRSVMGWTKHLAERVAVMALNGDTDLRASIVRFGNVIGSSGSVVPLFQKQIAAGGPVTITHPDMVRFFMTISEAVELVREAKSLTETYDRVVGGYVFDMGAPMRIMDVAENLIRFSGNRAGKDIEIKVVGLRPGEKLFEELTWPYERLGDTAHPKIRAIEPFHHPEIKWSLAELTAACENRDVKAVKEVMKKTGWHA
jgi:O-antigen biosynthesis protein WbqV